MADTNKTHDATPRRIQKARDQGSLPQSAEAVSAITLISLLFITSVVGSWFITRIKQELIESLHCRAELIDNSQIFTAYLNSKIILGMILTAPFLTTLTVCGVAGSLLISGWHFRPQALMPKLDELMPGQGIKNFISPETIIKLVTSIIKLVFISGLVFFYLQKKIPFLTGLQWAQTDQIFSAIGGLIFGAVIRICLGLAIIAAADLIYHRWKYFDQLKMSHEEVKEEFRDSEGPPELKSQVRRKQYELGMRRMLKKVPKASVVLVNPTHVAVALEYKPGQVAPVVVAKGAEHLCEKIKEIARAYGVPIIRRPELAREIYANVKLDHPIPDKLYTAVAEVLAVLYRLKHSYTGK
jgi:flagellar biosynthesis protein FlhB